MALDTKQKRGSATLLTLPFRAWLTEPDGALTVEDRTALLKLAATFGATMTHVRSHRYGMRSRNRTFVVQE
jgi:hypothetical protein